MNRLRSPLRATRSSTAKVLSDSMTLMRLLMGVSPSVYLYNGRIHTCCVDVKLPSAPTPGTGLSSHTSLTSPFPGKQYREAVVVDRPPSAAFLQGACQRRIRA